MCACPQLLDDGFRDRQGRGDAGDAPPGAGGLPDASPANVASSSAALAHRYGFDGFGPNPVDARGGPPAYLYNTALTGQGFVRLIGNDQYVSLPNGILSSTSDKTLEAWLTWRGGAAWQRIFDFGNSNEGERNQGVGESYLYLAASSDEGVMTAAYSQDGFGNEVRLVGTGPCPRDVLVHVTFVIDSRRNSMALYVNGVLDVEGTLTQRLGGIADVNVWLGRSQFADDPSLDADITEFRIYDAALAAADVALSDRLGPDAEP